MRKMSKDLAGVDRSGRGCNPRPAQGWGETPDLIAHKDGKGRVWELKQIFGGGGSFRSGVQPPTGSKSRVQPPTGSKSEVQPPTGSRRFSVFRCLSSGFCFLFSVVCSLIFVSVFRKELTQNGKYGVEFASSNS